MSIKKQCIHANFVIKQIHTVCFIQLIKNPLVVRRVFLCENDYFHYLMFFEDLEGFEGINGQMKKSVDMTFINKKNQL